MPAIPAAVGVIAAFVAVDVVAVTGIAAIAVSAVTGAVVSGLTAAVIGEDIGKSMLFGAIGGAVAGGIAGYMDGSLFGTLGGSGDVAGSMAQVAPETLSTVGTTVGETAWSSPAIMGIGEAPQITSTLTAGLEGAGGAAGAGLSGGGAAAGMTAKDMMLYSAMSGGAQMFAGSQAEQPYTQTKEGAESGLQVQRDQIAAQKDIARENRLAAQQQFDAKLAFDKDTLAANIAQREKELMTPYKEASEARRRMMDTSINLTALRDAA